MSKMHKIDYRYSPISLGVSLLLLLGLRVLMPLDQSLLEQLSNIILLGLTFGLFILPRLKTFGEALLWGEAFGLLWWLLFHLMLLPVIKQQEQAWTLTSLQSSFGSLAAYVLVFGALFGVLSFSVRKVIIRSHSPTEISPNPRQPRAQEIVPPLIQALIIGGIGGLLGSFVFLWGIKNADFFPLVASLIGSNLGVVGHLLHYIIGVVIGISFGFLFYKHLHSVGASSILGLSYGILWWFVGPLTLMPLFLGNSPIWSLEGARSVFPALIAHMLYGSLLGLVYAWLNNLWKFLFVDSDPLNRNREGVGTRTVRGSLIGQLGGIVGGLIFTIVMVDMQALPSVASLLGARSAGIGFIIHLIIAIIIGSGFGLFFHKESRNSGAALAWGLTYGFFWWVWGGLTLFALLLREPVNWSLKAVLVAYPSFIGHLLYGAALGLFFYFVNKRFLDDSPEQVVQPHYWPALWATVLVLGSVLLFVVSGEAEVACPSSGRAALYCN